MARNAWIVAKDRQKYLIWIYLSAAVANVLLNLALIPHVGCLRSYIGVPCGADSHHHGSSLLYQAFAQEFRDDG